MPTPLRTHLLAILTVAAIAAAVAASILIGISPPQQSDISLVEARKERDAGVSPKITDLWAVAEPPADLYRTVRYPTKLGDFAAYVSVVGDGDKHPALIWVKGGNHNSIGNVWTPELPSADEYSAFRMAGIVLMFPSLRGGNGNAGYKEGFYGEVDDVIAAADYLAKQDSVDARRIYLAGHSTGGTLALLTAEYSDRFRAVFSLAPVSDVRGYGDEFKPPIEKKDKRGFELRSPIYWLTWIKTPVFVFEGDQSPGNLDDLKRLARVKRNPLTHFYIVNGTNHVTSVLPVTTLMAEKILNDTGADSNIRFEDGVLTPL